MSHRDFNDHSLEPDPQAYLRRLAQWCLLIAGIVGMVSFGVAARTTGIVYVVAALLAMVSALLAGAAGVILCDLWPLFDRSDRSDPPEENQP